MNVVISTMSILKLFIFICSFKIGLGVFSNTQLLMLRDLEDYLCAFSVNEDTDQHAKYDPWYCVRNEYCRDEDVPIIKTILNCSDIISDINRGKCCHIKEIKSGIFRSSDFFGVDPSKVGVGSFDPEFLSRTSLSYFHQVEYTESVRAGAHEALDGHAICALLPAGWNSNNEPLFTPFICWHLDCHFSLPRVLKEDANWNKTNHKEYSITGERFCADYIFNRFCCHAAVAVKSNHIIESKYDKEWSIRLLSQHQKYAVGFRASFQCEQYSMLVCNGKNDLCPLRVLDQDTAPVPSEYSFQAMIGIQLRRTREFICGGALVSRLFILSASACEQYEGIPASIALLGEYDTTELQEGGYRYMETMTYLSEYYEENYDDLGGYKVALFRLWRPMYLNQFLKPACLDWRANFRSPVRPQGKYEEGFPTGYRIPFENDTIENEEGEEVLLHDYNSHGYLLPTQLIFSGFGSTTTYRGYNRTLKRVPMVFRYEAEMPSLVEECRTHLRLSRVKKIPSVLCNSPASVANNTIVEGPCEFDLGAPATTGERAQAPYCMRKIAGVALTVRYECDRHNVTPTLFKNTNFLMAWMEEVIWRYDFLLPAFDVSRIPPCHDFIEKSFRDMIHLNATGWSIPELPPPSDDLPNQGLLDHSITPLGEDEALLALRPIIGNRLLRLAEVKKDAADLITILAVQTFSDDKKIHILLDALDKAYGDTDKTFNRCAWRDRNNWWRIYKECQVKPKPK